MFYYTCHMLLSIITMKLLFRYSKKKKNITLARMEQSFYITCRLLIFFSLTWVFGPACAHLD